MADPSTGYPNTYPLLLTKACLPPACSQLMAYLPLQIGPYRRMA